MRPSARHRLRIGRTLCDPRLHCKPHIVRDDPPVRDLDTDPLNDWTSTQTSTELAFHAVGTNSLDWNTIYNVWFDCSIQPGAGNASIDQARPGPGALTVQVPSEVPSGLAFAQKHAVGSSCGACTSAFYEFFASMPQIVVELVEYEHEERNAAFRDAIDANYDLVAEFEHAGSRGYAFRLR